jgi:hypothetical protein
VSLNNTLKFKQAIAEVHRYSLIVTPTHYATHPQLLHGPNRLIPLCTMKYFTWFLLTENEKEKDKSQFVALFNIKACKVAEV